MLQPAATGIATAISDAPFYFANHGFIEGQMLVYEPNLDNYGTGAGNTALEGLTKGDIYFTVSKGQDYFSLAESSALPLREQLLTFQILLIQQKHSSINLNLNTSVV